MFRYLYWKTGQKSSQVTFIYLFTYLFIYNTDCIKAASQW